MGTLDDSYPNVTEVDDRWTPAGLVGSQVVEIQHILKDNSHELVNVEEMLYCGGSQRVKDLWDSLTLPIEVTFRLNRLPTPTPFDGMKASLADLSGAFTRMKAMEKKTKTCQLEDGVRLKEDDFRGRRTRKESLAIGDLILHVPTGVKYKMCLWTSCSDVLVGGGLPFIQKYAF